MFIAIFIICLYLYFKEEKQAIGRIHTKEEFEYLIKASQQQTNKSIEKQVIDERIKILNNSDDSIKQLSELGIDTANLALESGEINEYEHEEFTNKFLDLRNDKLR